MAYLKTEYRQVLWLLYFEELSVKEISQIMKKSPHAVETLTYRAKQSLKSELTKDGYDESFKNKFNLLHHLNPMGYRFLAEATASYIYYIIRHNMDDFKEVPYIGTDLHG